MNVETMVWVAAVLVFGGLLLWLLAIASRGEVRRCPETGSTAFVHTTVTADNERRDSIATVSQCNLWPARKGCAQGCLEQRGEIATGFRGDLEA